MRCVKGTDQIASAMAADGWLAFERPVPDVLAALVRAKGGLVLDVGANTGFYALIAVSVDPSVEVHAFEPYPPVVELLHDNLTVNRVGARIRVFEEAVGLSVSVAVTTLDEHIATIGPHSRVGVIKIDVESLEHEVLAGATELVSSDRPYIVLEVLPTSDVDALEEIRASCGYVDVCLRPHEAVVGGAIVFDADGWNHLFIPSETLDEGVALIESCGLAVRR
jgi:hypothetical protein